GDAQEAEPARMLAVIDEPNCIGCTKCIQACPVDCHRWGDPRHAYRDGDAQEAEPARMLAVIDEPNCIGCTKCIQACPVD
ncbi:hypothetical protein C0U44_31280, partial [Klebsiella pneumoniae]